MSQLVGQLRAHQGLAMLLTAQSPKSEGTPGSWEIAQQVPSLTGCSLLGSWHSLQALGSLSSQEVHSSPLSPCLFCGPEGQLCYQQGHTVMKAAKNQILKSVL